MAERRKDEETGGECSVGRAELIAKRPMKVKRVNVHVKLVTDRVRRPTQVG